ncbi:hypothetical protein CRE_13903 [Caenorhabditis remanei]|uniref:F-box domain-containing protein n=1 Tax=Caenorhabditis remanei TaxID=31234 RepID=E3M8L8_CAERE|nr:hypothetical protein CRE_13903 [Caenorhabditis remanei]
MEEDSWKPWKDEKTAMTQFFIISLNAFMGALGLLITLYNYYNDKKTAEKLLIETANPKSDTQANDKPFKVMDLPLVAFRHVADFWDPNEQYQLSKLSKKSKEIIKSAIKKRPSQLILAVPSRIVLAYSDTESFYFGVPHYQYPLTNEYIPVDHPRFSPEFPDRCFQMVNDLKDLFDSQFKRFAFFPKSLSWEDLYRIVDWINLDESLPNIPAITMNKMKNNGMFLKILLENLEKNVQAFTIRKMERSLKSMKIHHNFEIEDLYVESTQSLDINAFTSLKFSRAYLRGVDIQSEEINEILMSWKMGRFGDKMELFYAEDLAVMDLRIILLGLEAELRDPRTTKRSTILADGTPGWLCGGIDVTGVNGKTATIWLYSYQSTNEDDPIPEECIQKYENAQRNWNRIAGDDGDPVRDAIFVDTHLTITFE